MNIDWFMVWLISILFSFTVCTAHSNHIEGEVAKECIKANKTQEECKYYYDN